MASPWIAPETPDLVVDPVLVYSTYLGGSNGDGQANGIAVDSAGNAYITGWTDSTNFPVTPGAFQTTNNFGLDSTGNPRDCAFVAKLNATGSALVYSTYLGGTAGNGDAALGIAVDAAGSAYVTGTTSDPDFPTTPGAFRTSPGPGFVTKLNPSGSAPVYSTFLGAGGAGIAVDSSGDAYVPGDGASVSELNASGSAQVFSMTLGTSGRSGTTGFPSPSSPRLARLPAPPSRFPATRRRPRPASPTPSPSRP
jgi:hypothetical protein